MQGTSKREAPLVKKDTSQVRVVVEVDGCPVGVMDLDMERLWPLIHHQKRELPVEWVDRDRFDSLVRAAAVKKLVSRLEQHLYRTLGDEIVKTELDIESFLLKAEAAGQAFGRKKSDIEKLVADSGRTAMDFYSFFWEYLLDDRETIDIKKEWKAARNKLQ